MVISRVQIDGISKTMIRSSFPKFKSFFLELIEKETLFYDYDIAFDEYIKGKIEEGLQIDILSEAGITKFIFMNLLFDENFKDTSDYLELKKNIRNASDQWGKIELLDNFLFDVTDYDNVWMS